MSGAGRGRILTTHCGSLARPAALLDLMKVKAAGELTDAAGYDARVRDAVAACVRQQTGCGIDIPSDGEQSKLGFFAYVRERLEGFEAQPGPRPREWKAEIDAFPEYYEEYFSRAMLGRTVVPIVPLVCTGPVRYRGETAIQHDIGNLKSALAGTAAADAFLPSVAPSGVGRNRFYATEEEYLLAVADAMRSEYLAITGAGFLLQIDDPFLTDLYSYSSGTEAERQRAAELHVESLNHALRGIPPERIRFHTCYGINEGPRVHDAPLAAVLPMMLKVHAGAYSFEAANARHEHEYHVWETIRLPEDKILIPGVVTHASNIVEHPELIAERILRFARLVGRERVIAGTDCGFSSQATYLPEVHPSVVWEKFRAMRDGAALAATQLFSQPEYSK